MNQRIYLDHSASTSLDPHVFKILQAELQEDIGNPSSVHYHGQQARHKLDRSRQIIARFLGVKPSEIIFTSGGTEGANLLLRGILGDHSKGHIISSNVEHSCVYNTMLELEKEGYEVSYPAAGQKGAISPEQVLASIKPHTRLITLMAVNNETGVKTDIEGIAAIAEEKNIPFLVDAVALIGKEPFKIPKGVSAMFFSGHKIHAPKGVGFIFCRSKVKLTPYLFGGNQEFGRRPGTENVPGIVALGTAIELLEQNLNAYQLHMQVMKDRLERGLTSQLENIFINGLDPRVCNISNISFLGVDGESLLINLDMEGVSVSHGSACASGAIEPSRILRNMNLPLERCRSAIRFSVSRFTTVEEIDRAIDIIVRLVKKMRLSKTGPTGQY